LIYNQGVDMKAKYKFTYKDFRRWLKGTRETKMWPNHTNDCVLACFTRAAGVEEPCVTEHEVSWLNGKDLATPEWAKVVIHTFDNTPNPNGCFTAKEARAMLK